MDKQTPIATYPDRIGKPELRGYSPQDTRATVVWDDYDCEKYYVRWWIDGKEPSKEQCPVPMFTMNDLCSGSRYNIQVAACITEDDTEKCGRYSEVLTFQSGPEKPTDLFVQTRRKSSDTSFIVKFNYQQLPGIEHEVFYRSLTTGEINKVKADLGFAKIENLTPGDIYDIWVVASKEGVQSESCKLKDPMQTYPDRIEKPELRGYSPQDTRATIVWDDHDCEKYYVRWWIDGEEPSEKQCPVPMFTMNDLCPDSRYNIQVAACITEDDTEKCGRYSEVLTFQPGPEKPTDLFVQTRRKSSDTSFIVKFNYQQLPGIEHEVFYRSLTTGEINKVKADLGFAKIEHLTPGDTYDIWVVASKEGVESESCKLKDPMQTYPGKVEGLTTDKTSPTSQIISWKPAFGANAYLVKKKRCDGNYETIRTLDTELTLSNLDGGQTYKVCVAAENSSGISELSEPEIFTTDLLPPRHIYRSAICTGNDVFLEVKYTGSDQKIGKYVITAKSDSGDSQTKEEESCQTLFSNLHEGHCYTVSVQAVGTNGVESKKVYAEPIWIRPGTVKNVKSEALTGNSERVYWDDVEGAESYCIFVEKDGNSVEHKRNVPEITLTNLTLNKRCSVTVMAVNVGGLGKISKPVHFMTALSPPEDLKTSNSPHHKESGILVSWKGCDGAIEYEIDLIEVATNHPIPGKTKKCSYEFYDLKPSCEYRASVRSISDSQKRNSTLTLSDKIWTYCPKVHGLEAAYITLDTFTLKWNLIPSAIAYKLSYKPVDGNFTVIDTAVCYKTIPNLQLGMLHIAHVTAVNGAGAGQESEPVEFKTGMMPPAGLEVTNNPDRPSTSINCTLIEPQNKPSFYQARAIAVSRQHRSEIQKIDTDFCMTTICGLTPGVQYLVQAWSVYKADEKLNSEKVSSTKIWTCPCKIPKIQAHKDSTSSQIITWNKVPGATSYNIQLKKNGIAPVTQSTTDNNIHFKDLELNCQYSVSVTALNSGGVGEESDTLAFKTALHPVESVQVENSMKNPTTELIVRLEGSEASSTSKYKLRFINLNEGTVKEIIESGDIIELSGLHEGTKYKVGVTSVHETDEELNSEEIMSDPIWTRSQSLVVKTMSISHEEQKFTWNEIGNVSEYEFHWRIEHHRDWKQEIVYQDEFILENLEPGKKYEVYVTASNDSGGSAKSPMVQFFTVPAVPTDLQQQILSTQEVNLSCKFCEGADGYIFKINNKSYNTKMPMYTLQCEDLVDLEVTVQSYNAAGESNLSDVLKFRQVILLLQQKFKQMAKKLLNESTFVTPKLIKVPSGDVIEDLKLQATQIKEGDTVMIIGENFTGKTACCSYFLECVPNTKLTIFLNYEEVETLKTKFNVKSILHVYMTDLSKEEMDIVFHWIKNNSNQVVFIVDNFHLSPEFKLQYFLYETEGLPNEIFYNFFVTNRQFSKSQVFCSTSHDPRKQFLKPTLSINIEGFDDTGIMNMMKNILGKKSDIIDLSNVFRYFCANPGFCESILYWIKNNKINADPDSFSSVVVQLFLEKLNRYPLVQRKDKINYLCQKINNVPKRNEAANINPEKVKKNERRSSSQSQVATSVMESSLNSGGLSFLEYEKNSIVNVKSSINCDNLQNFFTIAMYFAFFCKVDDLKKRLKKKSLKFGSFANIWIMIAGFLREETMKTAKQIFEPAEIVIDEKEVSNKREVIKKFIKDNIANILKQIHIEPQITLNWFSICNELNDDQLLQMCKKKIEITDKSTTDEVDKAAEFLRQLPNKFCSNVKVKYTCNDATKTLTIDNAIRDNPNGEQILVTSEGSKDNFFLKRNSSKYHSRQELNNRMPQTDAPMTPANNQNDYENTDIQNQYEDGIGTD
ncbi:fibronectin-like [Styela clava]